MRLAYHEAARSELLNEITYLELCAPGLGRRFLEEIRRVESLILEHPKASRQVRPGIRKHVLTKFRYSLFYALEPDGPVILAVAHHSRRPGYWAGRSPEAER